MQAMLNGNPELAPFEHEVTRAYAGKGIQLRSANSFYVPFRFLNRAVVQKGSTGAELVAEDHWASEYVPHLISDLAVVRAGARVIPGLRGDVDIPAGDGAFATAAHQAETADTSEVIPAFKTIQLNAKSAGAHVPFTRRMRLQAEPALEAICRQGLNDSLAELVERTAFNGAGSSTVPRGIMQTSGVVAADFTGSPLGSYFDYINMWSALKGAKGTSQRLAFVSNYQVMTQALTTPRTEGDSRMIAELMSGGLEARIDGLRFLATQEFPTNLGSPSTNTGVIFGDWSKLLIGVFGDGLEISSTEAPLAKSGGLVVLAFLDYDLAVLQPKSFAVCDNIPA
jgi:HK97 family phage major capsid protein